MQFKLLALSAMAAIAQAQSASSSINLYVTNILHHQSPIRKTNNIVHSISVLSVLQTALPSTLVQEALTNSAAVSSQIASQFSAGQTPTWFTALPSDIQTFLVPLATSPGALSSVAANVTSRANISSAAAPTGIIAGGGPGGSISRNISSIVSAQSSIFSSIRSANGSAIVAGSSAGASASRISSASAGASGAAAGASSASRSGSAAAAGSASGSATGSAAAATSSRAASATSSAGAVPTAVVGMGLAGVVGLVGIFAL
ncbi:hypothetical protein BAUCODRAFT_204022 [Baudoinia panamericana UAMH 10762]|uniref:FAS1 domain-containing protein n=1 Tax=Baudoinia panamericana (strain UAMH 10762) TaxID=717646 RepID=M2M2C2_BAUPA|nr:uncharacterized protein BAUCODRAFT_204022 [Baudoinia panamericana UAMH 10762]EMD01258.1 hypothetical protein BAUCODRAFT_204022 [Baudoinia panamericana UAMH 10762]